MKKIVAFILFLCMVVMLAACNGNGGTPSGNDTPEENTPKITMQEILDAGQVEALLKNHQSVSIQDKIDGEVCIEKHLTKEYIYTYFPGGDGESDFMEFITADAFYCYMNGGYLRYLPITPDGVGEGFTSLFAERYASGGLIEDGDTIESVSQKDGLITVKSVWGQEVLEEMAELGVTAGKFEFVLDAKTREIISFTGDYTYDDGTAFRSVTEVTYDAEAPDVAKTFLKYANQTEEMRQITVVSNPGTEREVSQSVQAPKGLIIGLRYEEDSEYEFEVYTDAACTESYDPYVNTDSDLTIYVKWNG